MDDKMRTDALMFMVSEHAVSGMEVPEVMDTVFGGRPALVAMWSGLEAQKMCSMLVGGRDSSGMAHGPFLPVG